MKTKHYDHCQIISVRNGTSPKKPFIYPVPTVNPFSIAEIAGIIETAIMKADEKRTKWLNKK